MKDRKNFLKLVQTWINKHNPERFRSIDIYNDLKKNIDKDVTFRTFSLNLTKIIGACNYQKAPTINRRRTYSRVKRILAD